MITKADKGPLILTTAALSMGIFIGAMWQAMREHAEVRTHIGHVVDSPALWVLPLPAHDFDLANPFDRCLAAMEAAEIPGWMWECREYEPA